MSPLSLLFSRLKENSFSLSFCMLSKYLILEPVQFVYTFLQVQCQKWNAILQPKPHHQNEIIICPVLYDTPVNTFQSEILGFATLSH